MKSWADFDIDAPSHGSGEHSTTCPRCSHERKKKNVKCLSANLTEGVWCCHHCGWSGTLMQGEDKNRARLHWQKPRYRKPVPRERTNLPEKTVAWFMKRGISEKTLLKNRVHQASVYFPQTEREEPAIAFPYYRDGELINCKYRAAKKHFRLEAGAERCLYGYDDMEDMTYIVEGEIDKLTFSEVGIQQCVSVPDGAPAVGSKDYSGKFDFLEGLQPRKWILAVDTDEPGRVLKQELIRRLGAEHCYTVEWPQDCKDANEVLVKHGARTLLDCAAAPREVPLDGVFTAHDISAEIDALYRNGLERGCATGWKNLDPFWSVRPGEMTIVTGIPNSGKSQWVDALAVNLADEHGWRVVLCSPENQPIADHAARYEQLKTGVPFEDGPIMRMSPQEEREARAWVGEHVSWILEEEMTLDSVLDKARTVIRRRGSRLFVIDPWNEIEHQFDGLSETQYVSRCLTKIRQFARHNGVHVIVVAHPSKLYRDKDGNYPIPTPYDIAGSAHWRNKADNCITVYRDFETNKVEIYVQKVRFRQIGKIGMAQLKYDLPTGRYKSA